MPKIEPLNSNYDEEKVVEAISVALSEFYTSLTNKLNKIKLKDIFVDGQATKLKYSHLA